MGVREVVIAVAFWTLKNFVVQWNQCSVQELDIIDALAGGDRPLTAATMFFTLLT